MKRQRNEHDEVTVTLRALCTVSNFNYICLISSMKIRLPLLSRPVKGTPNPMPNSRVCSFF
ncbi:unnamed protein product [Prunus armeniaca]